MHLCTIVVAYDTVLALMVKGISMGISQILAIWFLVSIVSPFALGNFLALSSKERC